MFNTLQELLDRLDLTALGRGLSATNPITITIKDDSTNNLAVRFVVSHTEPTGLDIPLNVLWYVRAPASPDFNKLLRRSSRSPSQLYSSTWGTQSDLTAVLTTEQVWDIPEPDGQELYDHSYELGNAHDLEAADINALGDSGGTLTGPLNLRSVVEPDVYGESEAVPKSWINTLYDQIQGITENIIQSFDNINAQIDNLRTRVEILELSLLGLKGYLFDTTSASAIWNIAHNMDNTRVVVQVYENNEVVWPATIEVVDANNVRITFAEPVEGYAQVLPIVRLA